MNIKIFGAQIHPPLFLSLLSLSFKMGKKKNDDASGSESPKKGKGSKKGKGGTGKAKVCLQYTTKHSVHNTFLYNTVYIYYSIYIQ